MIKYCFRDPERLIIRGAKKANAQKIGQAMAAIQEQHGGELKPSYLWKAAEGNPRHVLHRHFTWDVREAAEAHWDRQARSLIRCIHVETSENGSERDSMQAYLSIKDRGGMSYRSVGEVLNSRDLQLRVLQQAGRDLESFEQRYAALEDICGIVRGARERINERLGTALQPSQEESRSGSN